MPSYTEMCIAACMANKNHGKGASRHQIKAFIMAANGKYRASAASKALRGDSFTAGSTSARFKATDAAVASTKPKKKRARKR